MLRLSDLGGNTTEVTLQERLQDIVNPSYLLVLMIAVVCTGTAAWC